jgi:small subunit ribosomal protein S2
MAKIGVTDLLEAGVHFGHQTKRWNPKMRDYVYGVKSGIYIIDLAKTMRQLADACNFLQHVVSDGGEILFVGTKRQAQSVVKDAAEKTSMHYVSERWLGGTLTNNETIKRSIGKMREIDALLESDAAKGMGKKELASLRRQSAKLHRNLGGILDMRKLPAVLVVVDICHEEIAIKEARKLKIPIVAIVDTNANPELVDYPIPANDDAMKSIAVIVNVMADAANIAAELYKKRAEEERKRLEAEKAKAKEEKEKARKAAEAEKKAAAKKKADEKAKPKSEKKSDVKKDDVAEADKAAKKEDGKAPAKKSPAKKTPAKKTAVKKDADASKAEPEKASEKPAKEPEADMEKAGDDKTKEEKKENE